MGFYDDQLAFDLGGVERDLREAGAGQVQFDGPVTEMVRIITLDDAGNMIDGPRISRDDYFAQLREMCARWGDRLNVRFYGHEGDVFDAAILERLPELASLTVNCLSEAANLDQIATLKRLRKLQIGVFNMQDPALLSRLQIADLTELTLEEASTKALDLAPLAGGTNLKRLRIFGHKKNIGAVGKLASLEEFAFNPAKNSSLEFLNGMPRLRAVKFVLGSLENIAEFDVAPALDALAFTMVRGLTGLGDLQRFPQLANVLIQDQPHVRMLETGARNAALRHFWFENCPNLEGISGLDRLPRLVSLRANKTGLRLGSITLPKSLTHLALYSGKPATERAERAAIEALGLDPQAHPEMPFFYK